MLKKLVSCLLALLMVLTTFSAVAEETFTLRNGIQFGDTMDQVREKETLGWNADSCTDTSLRTENGTVAGFDNVAIVYFFDESGKLTDVRWDLPSTDYSDSSDTDYEKLNKAFVQKYGSTLGYTNGNCYIITGKALETAILGCALFEMIDAYGDIRDYDEWDYEYSDNGHVKIEIVQFACGESILDAQYYIYVGYKHFTDADLKDAQNEKQQENQAIMDDI